MLIQPQFSNIACTKASDNSKCSLMIVTISFLPEDEVDLDKLRLMAKSGTVTSDGLVIQHGIAYNHTVEEMGALGEIVTQFFKQCGLSVDNLDLKSAAISLFKKEMEARNK